MSWNVSYIPGLPGPDMSLVLGGQNLPVPVVAFVVPTTVVDIGSLQAYAVEVTSSGYLSSTSALVDAMTTPGVTSQEAMEALIAGTQASHIALSIDSTLRSNDPAVVANGATPGTVCRLWAQATTGMVGLRNFFIYITDSGDRGSSLESSTNFGEPILLCNLGGLRAPNALTGGSLEAVWNVSCELTVGNPGQPSGAPTFSSLTTLPTYTDTDTNVTWYLAPFYPNSDQPVEIGGKDLRLVAQFTASGGVPCDYGTSVGGASSLPTDSSYPTENAPYLVTVWENGLGSSSMSVDDLHVVQTVSSPGVTLVSLYMLGSTRASRSGSDSLQAFVNLRDGADRVKTLPFRIVSVASPMELLGISPQGRLANSVYNIAFAESGVTTLVTLAFTPDHDRLAYGSGFTDLGFQSSAIETVVSFSETDDGGTVSIVGNADAGSGAVNVQYTSSSSGEPTPRVNLYANGSVTEFGRTFTFQSSNNYPFQLGRPLSQPSGWDSTSSTAPYVLDSTSGAYGSNYYVASDGSYLAVSTGNLSSVTFPVPPIVGGVGPVSLTVTMRADHGDGYGSSAGTTGGVCKYVAPSSINFVPIFSTLSGGTDTNVFAEIEVNDATGFLTSTLAPNSDTTYTLGGLEWPSYSYGTDLNNMVTAGGMTVYTPALVTLTLEDETGTTFTTHFVLRVYADPSPFTASYLLDGNYTFNATLPAVDIHLAPGTMFYAGGVWNDGFTDVSFENESSFLLAHFGGFVVGVSVFSPQTYTDLFSWTDLTGNGPSAITLTVNFYNVPTAGEFKLSADGGSTFLEWNTPLAIILEPLTLASALGLGGDARAVVNRQDQSLCLFPGAPESDVPGIYYQIQDGVIVPPAAFITAENTSYVMTPTLYVSDTGTSLGSSCSSGEPAPNVTLVGNTSSAVNVDGPALFSLMATPGENGLPIGGLNPSSFNTLDFSFVFTDTTGGWVVPHGGYISGSLVYYDFSTTTVTFSIPLIINTVQVLMNVAAGDSSIPFIDTAMDGGSIEQVDQSSLTTTATNSWLYNPNGLFVIPSSVPTNATITLSLVVDNLPGAGGSYPNIAYTGYTGPTITDQTGVNAGFYIGTVDGGGTTAFTTSVPITYDTVSSSWIYGEGQPISQLTAVAYAASGDPLYTAHTTYNYYLLVLATVTLGSNTFNLTLNPAGTYDNVNGYESVFPPNAMTGFNSSENGGGYFGDDLLLQLEITCFTSGSTGSAESSEGSFSSEALLANFRRFWSTAGTEFPSLHYQIPDSIGLELGNDAGGALAGAGSYIRFQLECSSGDGTWYILASNLGLGDEPVDLVGLNAAIVGPFPERQLTINPDGSIPPWGLPSVSAVLEYRLGIQTDWMWRRGGYASLLFSNSLDAGSWRNYTITTVDTVPTIDFTPVNTQFKDYHHPSFGGNPATFRLAQTDTGRFLRPYHSVEVALTATDASTAPFFYFVQQGAQLDSTTSFPTFGTSGPNSSLWF